MKRKNTSGTKAAEKKMEYPSDTLSWQFRFGKKFSLICMFILFANLHV